MPSISIPADTAAAEAPGARAKVRFSDMFRTADGRNHVLTFVLVSTLFALWGFCNGQLDILNKHFQASLNVSKTGSAFVQFANFIGYFVMAIPSGIIAKKLGYKGGIIVGLGLVAVGAFWFIPATRIGTFPAFLAGLFILASGLAFLETVANPYTTVLGPSQGAAARINLAQSCNGLGVMLGPIVGGSFILSDTAEANRSNETLYLPYLGIGIVVTILAVLFAVSKVPDIEEKAVASPAGGSLWKRPHLVWAVVTQFFYVGAQIAIWAFFINYIVSETPALGAGIAGVLPDGWTAERAGAYVVTDRGASRLFGLGAFGLFLIGRIVGSFVLRTASPQRTLAIYGLINAGLMALVMAPLGWISVAALFGSFFFMSIMFPTIFSLGIHGLGEHTKRASAYIVMAIVGGALLPFPTGWIADTWSMALAFAIPLLCFLVVFWYALSWERLERRSRLA
jgi:MFS transporter, FHS family, L-fucose permease